MLYVAAYRRRGYRLDLLHAVQHFLFERIRGRGGARDFHRRLLVDSHGAEFHRDHPPHARAGADLVPSAAVCLGALRHQHDSGSGHSGHRRDSVPAGARARTAYRVLRSRIRRRSGAVPASVLVLFASGGLHHDSAVDGRGHRNHLDVSVRRSRSAIRSSHFRASRLRSSDSSSGAITCLSAASRFMRAWCSRF